MSYKISTVIDLFCGAGGLSHGFSKAGYDIIAANDIWKSALETYTANNENITCSILGDLSEDKVQTEIVRIAKSHNIDVIIGGPPCQEFSSAGKREANGKGANMTPLFAQIVCKVKPVWFVMENVNTLLSIGQNQLSKCEEILRKAGYGLTSIILNAADFGVPQDRKRLFLIGHFKGDDNEIYKYLSLGKKRKLTVREYMPEITEGENSTEFYYRHPRTYLRKAIFSIDEQSPVIRGVNRPIPKTYRFHENDAIKDISKVRPLTYLERSRIQSFPHGYIWTGSRTQIEQQIGNAAPPLLSQHVAETLIKLVE